MFKTPLLYLSAFINYFFRLPVMQRLARKYPKVFNFLLKRFHVGNFFGLPFTLIFLLVWVNTAMLSELAENVVNSAQMKAMDAQFSLMLFKIRFPALSYFLYYFTQLNSIYGVTIISALAGIFLILKRKWYYLLALLISVLGSSFTMYYSKLYFHRERPLNIAYYPEQSFSFPSGHSTAAVALEGLLFYLLILESKSVRKQYYWLTTGLVYIFLIGFSRIYLGVHFLTDVLAGFLLGFLWVLFAIVIMEFFALKNIKKQPASSLDFRDTA